MTTQSKYAGYNVYHAQEGSDQEFIGFAHTLEEAQELAEKASQIPGYGIEASLYGTLAKAGHCAGIRAQDTTREEDEPAKWFGDYCAVGVRKKTARFVVDMENNTEEFWEYLHSLEVISVPEPLRDWLMDRYNCGEDEIELTGDDVDTAIEYLESLPGWSDPEAPAHAPHPILIEVR